MLAGRATYDARVEGSCPGVLSPVVGPALSLGPGAKRRMRAASAMPRLRVAPQAATIVAE